MAAVSSKGRLASDLDPPPPPPAPTVLVTKVVGDQRVELPAFDREDQYPNDWHQTVRDLL
jgi:hypothetical protein